MKILELYLKAYGPFTERRVELQHKGSHGLHVVFGKNEAGKSSALRAIHDLLYGIPLRTTENFFHDNASMRIGGRLVDSAGHELAFLRKTGKKNTLRSWDDSETIDDDALVPFLSGVPGELFVRYFGIDHPTLVAGSQNLLEDDGDVGKSLFAAGLGSGNPRKVISSLEAEAKELFAPRGKKPSINANFSKFQKINKEIRSSALKPSEWEEHDLARSQADSELGVLATDLGELRSQKSRLERIRSASPLLAGRKRQLDAITDMGVVVPLNEAFEERLKSAMDMQKQAEDDRRGAEGRLPGIKGQLEALDLDPAILDDREVISLFRERLGSYKESCKQLPLKEGELNRLVLELRATLCEVRSDLELDQLDELRAVLARRRQIEGLANEHGSLETQVENSRKALHAAEKLQGDARDELAGLPPARDAAGLSRAIKSALALGEVDTQVTRLAGVSKEAELNCTNQLKALRHWSSGLKELERLPVPEVETVERFQHEFDELQKDREKLLGNRKLAADEIQEIETQLGDLRQSGAVASKEELAAHRERRDAGWRLVRRHWIAGEPIEDEIAAFAQADSLPDVYERSVSTADETADHLHRDADRVANQASLMRRHERAEGKAADTEEAFAALAQQEAEIQTQWCETWQALGSEPDPPREMLAWLRKQQSLVTAAADARGKAGELSDLESSRSERLTDLLTELQVLDENVEIVADELAPMLTACEEIRDLLVGVEGRREELNKILGEEGASLGELRDNEEGARLALTRWHTDWTTAVECMGLSKGSLPSEGLERLDTIKDLLNSQQEKSQLEDLIGGYRLDKQVVENELNDFVQRCAPELAGEPVEQTIRRLSGKLSEIDQQETLRGKLNEDATTEVGLIQDAEGLAEEATKLLSTLREEAHCSDDAALEEALCRSKASTGAQANLAEIEKQLVEGGGGATVEELESEAREVDRDSISGRLEALCLEIDELETQRTVLMARRATANAELERMNGSEQVAASAELAQSVLAEMRRDTERYVALRLAQSILEREIEQYRKQHQAPLLLRARELFSQLTLGAYTNLQSHYDDDDRPQLMGVRADGRTVGVAGMSSGTRDQLFLALRLANLDERLESAEPMPFIVDDILVNFDDERARATLEVLAGLGERNQVLLFTHHERIREYAVALGDRAAVQDLGES